MRKTLFSLVLSTAVLSGLAQVDQKIIAEHFTNTKCSACASRNPGLITNFKNNPEVIHISFHPSRPYSTCVLNNHNGSENDERTKYYNIFGGTPQLTLNGVVHSGSFNPSSIFDPYKGKTAAIDISSSIVSQGTDSLNIKVMISTKATHSFGTEKIGIFVVEDTVFYDAPNGEKQHYNVFRKALSDVKGDDIMLSNTIGNIDIISFSIADHKDWDIQRMRVVTILQKSSDKSVIQAAQSPVVKAGFVSKVEEAVNSSESSVLVYPNPTTGNFYVDGLSSVNFRYSLIDLVGKTILNGQAERMAPIDGSSLIPGYYIITIQSDGNVSRHRILKQ